MTRILSTPVALAVTLLAAQIAFGADLTPALQTPPAATPAAKTYLPGRVTAVDAAVKSVTVMTRQPQISVTFTVNDDTKYIVDVRGAVSDIKVGDTLRIAGDVSTDGKSIDARGINVISAGSPTFDNSTVGTVATITPALTIMTTYNESLTVNTTDSTRVTIPKDGSWANIKTGVFVMATVVGPYNAPVATQIHFRTGGSRPAGN